MINKYILIGIFLSFSGLFFGLVISLGGGRKASCQLLTATVSIFQKTLKKIPLQVFRVQFNIRYKNKVSHNKERPYFYSLSREILEKKKINLKIEGGYYLCQ